MKAIEFPEVNVRIAENQPQYETLPVHIDTEDSATPTTMCFQLDPEEIKQVVETGRVWMQMLTFGQSFHPIKMSLLKPEGFTEPENAKMATFLNGFAKSFHESAVKKGFWDEEREIGTLLMLIVSELAEALEADRRDRHDNIEEMNNRIKDRRRRIDDILNFRVVARTHTIKEAENETEEFTFKEAFKYSIKDTFEDEIADTFIRLFDLVGHLGIDIDKHIELKMEYNQTRAYKHGKAY